MGLKLSVLFGFLPGLGIVTIDTNFHEKGK